MNGSSLILPRIQHKVFFSCIANCIRRWFPITQLLVVNLWARIPWQIGDSPSALFLYFSVNFHNVLALHFKVQFDQHFCSEFYGHDWLQTCRYNPRELWDLFAEVREKSVIEFRSYWLFLLKCGFKHMPISLTFLNG